MSTPVVLDGEFVTYTKTKDGFQVTFSVTPDQLEALNGDLH